MVTGILAHVDAGKTTLSEALLYEAGAIRNLGRVDSKNAFLDNNSIERERGITIFSKQAILNDKITLIDTPGHVDFSAEMERALAVLDSAVLLINASDGIQSHTKTLWSLLKQYNIPTVIFVNKMDMPDVNSEAILAKLKENLSENVIDFLKMSTNIDEIHEEIAASDEFLLEKYLNGEKITSQDISKVFSERKIFPCVFGSALKLQGVSQLLEILSTYIPPKVWPEEFGCQVYKISKDKQNSRLTHLKVTGGVLHVKDTLGEEKANEVRLYSGEKYEMVKEVFAGSVCTVTGLKNSYAGVTYGTAAGTENYRMEPALIYSVIPPSGLDTPKMLQIMRELEEELPEIKVEYSSATSEICVKLMGEVQTEVIKQLLQDRKA